MIKKQSTISFSNLYTNFIKTNISLGENSLKLQTAWHSKLSKFLLGTRNKTTIFNYRFTLKCLMKAVYVSTALIKRNGTILIVNTNPELSKLMYHIKKNTHCNYLFFSDCGWTKGTLTNWKQVYEKIKTFASFYNNFDIFLNENSINFPNYKKMKKNYKGFLKKNIDLQSNKIKCSTNFFFEKKKLLVENSIIRKNNLESTYTLNCNLNWKPDIIILISTDNAECIINEASSTNIPVIAFLNSNSNTHNITYPIPTNTYSYCFVWFFFNCLTKLNNKHYFTAI